MGVPKHLWRYSTREAIGFLAARFRLSNDLDMQDWEIEVADAARIDEFLTVLRLEKLDEDQQFTLMAILVQSFEESNSELRLDSRWKEVLSVLDQKPELHAYTIWYWSCTSESDEENIFRVSPWVRTILAKHRTRLENPEHAG